MLTYSQAILLNNFKSIINTSTTVLRESFAWLTSLTDRKVDHTHKSSVLDINWLPVLENIHAPRWPIVLCHGLFGFDKRGPEKFPKLQFHYWSSVENILTKLGAKIIITKVPPTGTIISRANALHEILENSNSVGKLNFIAHSMGGLDCRFLISHHKQRSYEPLSLTTLSTPHQGSPFMNWCRDYIGLGTIHNEHKGKGNTLNQTIQNHLETFNLHTSNKENLFENSINSQEFLTSKHLFFESSSFLSNILDRIPTLLPPNFNIFNFADTPAYANLTTDYLCEIFNPNTPNDPNVHYYSIGSQILNSPPIFSPLYLPYNIVKAMEGDNDGLVSVSSAKWGRYLGTLDVDHWDLRGGLRIFGRKRRKDHWDVEEFYVRLATFLWTEGL